MGGLSSVLFVACGPGYDAEDLRNEAREPSVLRAQQALSAAHCTFNWYHGLLGAACHNVWETTSEPVPVAEAEEANNTLFKAQLLP